MEQKYVVSLNDSVNEAVPSELANKEGRVRVAVRCRPPFPEEFSSDGQPPQSVVPDGNRRKLTLMLENGAKPRDFYYDKVFLPGDSQTDVYNEVGGPLVAEVLKGVNGSILAYGQTGTGKTYTMGILTSVTTEHAGLIPRALSHIYGHISQHPSSQWRVTMSFIQLYLETVQDLFSPSFSQAPMTPRWSRVSATDSWLKSTKDAGKPPTASAAEQNLAVRETPGKGFYVEGVQEYAVRSYSEAIELLNWGLENRIMGQTQMNATSSRSHTLLTVKIKQDCPRDEGDSGRSVRRVLRSKLVLVDLAGSERVRRTTSKGVRLSEARSINTSLSSLGNVIAALSDKKSKFIPYRDSKLTKLLSDCLGGHSNTYLIATVGPAAVNDSETLSTLLFASRCMHVKVAPTVNEEVDYADLCAKLQSRLANIETEFLQREAQLKSNYEDEIRRLSSALAASQREAAKYRDLAENVVSSPPRLAPLPASSTTFSGASKDWQQTAEALYAVLYRLYVYSAIPLAKVAEQLAIEEEVWEGRIASEEGKEEQRRKEALQMRKEDPGVQGHPPFHFGPHLTPLTLSHAFSHIHSRHRNNNDADTAAAAAAAQHDNAVMSEALVADSAGLSEFPSSSALFEALQEGRRVVKEAMAQGVLRSSDFAELRRALKEKAKGLAVDIAASTNEAELQHLRIAKQTVTMEMDTLQHMRWCHELFRVKDANFDRVKLDLANALSNERKREEEVLNAQYVCKYLVDTTSRLRRQLLALEGVRRESGGHEWISPATAGSKHRDSGLEGVRRSFGSQKRTPLPPLTPLSMPSLPSSPSTTASRGVQNMKIFQRNSEGTRSERPGGLLSGRKGSGRAEPRSKQRMQQAVPPSLSFDAASLSNVSIATPLPRPPPSTATPNPHRAIDWQRQSQGPRYTKGQLQGEQHMEDGTEKEEKEERAGEEGGDSVEAIIGERSVDGRVMYKVHWRNSTAEDDEWFERKDLLAEFPGAVAAWEAAQGTAKGANGSGRDQQRRSGAAHPSAATSFGVADIIGVSFSSEEEGTMDDVGEEEEEDEDDDFSQI